MMINTITTFDKSSKNIYRLYCPKSKAGSPNNLWIATASTKPRNDVRLARNDENG